MTRAAAAVVIEDGLEYDSYGRMQYHPEFHFNHGTPFEEDELEYLCKFYETDSTRSLSFALGRTERTVRSKIDQLRKTGMYQVYIDRWNARYDLKSN
ncbi:DNA-entry nuclease [Brevibacillus fortis]|uniref:DNA-entry nuclease n=1 Tax=Brevibacillus fortis TaxID=2126352 RepID=A0A2P7V3U7_9BACL|nr:DNA-entry nuclease [Brevibacillus fortis]PSJ93882.1 DNA-entry nuclease [Brevibacillus fortis]